MDSISNKLKIAKPLQSRWIRKARQALGLDVKTLAGILDVSQRTINAWENESNNNLPSRDCLFIYLILMFAEDGSSLPEPIRLIEISKSLNIAGNEPPAKVLSRFFTRLNRNNQAVVNMLTRTLYRTQRRL